MAGLAILGATASALVAPAAFAEAPNQGRLEAACTWLEAAVAVEPERDDAFGMYMRSMRPKCQGALEGLGRGDGSVTAETVDALSQELDDLRIALGAMARDAEADAAAEPSADAAVVPPAEVRTIAPAPEREPGGNVAPPTQQEPTGARGAISGTWSQAPRKVLDQEVKRTLNLFQKGKAVEGELYEEVWHPAPSGWVEASCGGNATFRMVTTAKVSGELRGAEVELRRDVPRVLACTCPSRCRVEQRRRGFALALSPSGMQLSDEQGVFLREGAPAAVATGVRGGLAGEWETGPIARRGETLVLHLMLEEGEGGKVHGTLTVRSDQDLPLKSWSERFCAGADRFAHVDAFDVSGRRQGDEVELAVKGGRVVTCTCPSKCFTPKRRGFTVTMTPDGRSLRSNEGQYERR